MVIAKTDADGVGRDLGSRYGVTGFPSTFRVSISHARYITLVAVRTSAHGRRFSNLQQADSTSPEVVPRRIDRGAGLHGRA